MSRTMPSGGPHSPPQAAPTRVDRRRSFSSRKALGLRRVKARAGP
jgi:hypothetical protein